jgi:hypothetical protein
VPPSILAVVMVLQRLEGLSDREAADRFAFDVRGGMRLGWLMRSPGRRPPALRPRCWSTSRARLRRAADPDRIFQVTCELTRQVGLVGVRRVLDSGALAVLR